MQLKSSRGVQQREADAAADALLAEKLRPTVERVRTKMGRGSPNTVAPMLEAWFAGLAPRLGVVATEEGRSPGTPATVRNAMDSLWELALRVAHEQVHELLENDRQALAREREEFETVSRAIERERTLAGLNKSMLEQSLQDAHRRIEERTSEMKAARALLVQRENELERARASIAELVGQKDDGARAHALQVEKYSQERTRLMDPAAASEKRLLEEVDRSRQEFKVAQRSLAEVETRAKGERDAATRECDRLTNEANKSRLENVRLSERLEAAQTAMKERKAPARSAATVKRIKVPLHTAA